MQHALVAGSFIVSSLLFAGSAPLSWAPREAVSPVLRELMEFHPSWVTRRVTSHDMRGENGDGSYHGLPAEQIDGKAYQVLLHDKGEGRISRIWMTTALDDGKEPPKGYDEIWIILDGITVFRGQPLDFFEGRAGWAHPLVYSRVQSSGAYLSYVPFAYSREAKILFRSSVNYYQIDYREGAGSSQGPSSEALASFLSEAWEAPAPTLTGEVRAGSPLRIAEGGQTLSRLMVRIPRESLSRLKVRVGAQEPVPVSFFFGLPSAGTEPFDGGWTSFTNALQKARINEGAAVGLLATRLPIPLQDGETLELVATGNEPIKVAAGLAVAEKHVSGTHLLAQYRDQMAPGARSTVDFFVSQGPTTLVSLIEELLDGKPGDRMFLEGDDMVRLDQMAYPLLVGTGTEDTYNGGWYFMGPHVNPLTGLSRFIVNDPEDGWVRARYELSLYRHHVADPIITRSGVRLGFEAGPLGDYSPLRLRSLTLAYGFDGWETVSRRRLGLPQVRFEGRQKDMRERSLVTAMDAEHDSPAVPVTVRYSRGLSILEVTCPRGQAHGLQLIRTYDAEASGQEAAIRVGGRHAGRWFEAYANPYRRLAETTLWVDLTASDCAGGKLRIEIDSSGSPVAWSEVSYDAVLYARRGGLQEPVIQQGAMERIFDSRGYASTPCYVNDHTLVRDAEGRWHLFGIFHAETFNSGDEREFVHAVSSSARTPGGGSAAMNYAPVPVGLTAEPRLGERHIWAPHVLPFAGGYLMAYHSGGRHNHDAGLRIATTASPALHPWTRISPRPVFEDVCVARDPMIRRHGDLWIMYYTRCDSLASQKSGVAYRVSFDLQSWSEPRMALVLSDTPPMFNSGYTESPFVIERDGWFYLTVTSYPIEWDATMVYRSRDPFHFEPVALTRLRSHAAEWIEDPATGQLWMTHAGPGQGGVWIAPVTGL